ncbi:iduronate sulfatase, partial [Verrucomicrobia bacterium]|nr:iduronate sulfatase [Verrucomicrobiota bacterium]
GDWGKHTLWERTSNVPFIWAGPGIAKGVKTDVSVSLIDMYPTLVDLTGVAKPPHKLEGVSLAKTLADPSMAKDRNVYLPYMSPNAYAIINRNWRYIHYDDNTEELYQVQDDPNEWFNLANKPEYAKRIKQLQKSAPKTFAEPGAKLNRRKNLVIEGESYYWDPNKTNKPDKKTK